MIRIIDGVFFRRAEAFKIIIPIDFTMALRKIVIAACTNESIQFKIEVLFELPTNILCKLFKSFSTKGRSIIMVN